MSAGSILTGKPILFSQGAGVVNLAGGSSSVSGVLPLANGGTASTDGSITGSGALSMLAGGTNQNFNFGGSGTGVATTPSALVAALAQNPGSAGGLDGALRIPNGGISCAGICYFQFVFAPGGLNTPGLQLAKTTITPGTTTTPATANTISGRVNLAIGATTFVVNNSTVTANSTILCTVASNDTTMKTVSAVAGSGSFTITPNAAPTAECKVNFLVIN